MMYVQKNLTDEELENYEYPVITPTPEATPVVTPEPEVATPTAPLDEATTSPTDAPEEEGRHQMTNTGCRMILQPKPALLKKSPQ